MITERGVVEKILHHKAMVRVEKSAACVHCESRGACHVTAGRSVLIEVPNDLQAAVNDHVEISVSSGSLLRLSLLVYLLPILALIIGAYAGNAWATSFHLQPTLASIGCGAIAMVLAFYALKRLDRHAQAKGKYQPRMTRVLASAGAPEPDDSR